MANGAGMTGNRRDFLKGTALGALAFQVAGSTLLLSPREARARDIPFSSLTDHEARTLDALGEILLPGARDAGISHFVDSQVTGAHADSLLMIRYLDVPPPYLPFYQGGLAGLDQFSLKRHQKNFAGLDPVTAHALVGDMAAGKTETWSGPPAPFFYFVTRSDAVDVVYGTMKGFEKLGIPYLAHIEPESDW